MDKDKKREYMKNYMARKRGKVVPEHPLNEPDMSKPALKVLSPEEIVKKAEEMAHKPASGCYWGGILDPSTDSNADKTRPVKRDGNIVYFADGSIARDWNGALQMIHFHHDETCRQSWEAKLKAEEVLRIK